MKLYNSLGPNPRLVRMFAQEKKLDLATEEVDIMGGENRQPAYLEKNPGGQLPALELDDGEVLAETVVICEYLEELHPEPALIGATPEERAHTRMWTRRIEAKIVQPLTDGFRYAEGLGMFKDRLRLFCRVPSPLDPSLNESAIDVIASSVKVAHPDVNAMRAKRSSLYMALAYFELNFLSTKTKIKHQLTQFNERSLINGGFDHLTL